MADHLDAFFPGQPSLLTDTNPGEHAPAMDPRVDITDIYAFQKPSDKSRSILIMNVNPLALSSAFRPDAIYEVKVDTNADAVAEIAFRIRFSELEGGAQTANVHRATGALAAGTNDGGPAIINAAPVSLGSTATITQQNGFQFFAGLRSDPFFFDLVAFLKGFQFAVPPAAGSDFFIDKNVFGIVLDVPNAALGSNPNIGVWGRTLIEQNDTLVQIDRMGRPAINTVFNHMNAKNTFNMEDPTQDRAGFEASFVSTLESFGYSSTQATTIAEILLPDILTYDFSSSAGFLNGRQLADDVIDIELNLVTNGRLTTDRVGPHSDYLSDFPYLGNPH